MSSDAKLITWGISGVVILALVILMMPFTIVDAGEQAVITRNGAVARVVGPGMHFVSPIIEGVVKFDVRTQKEEASASAASSDLQTVSTTVAVNYNVNASTVADMYTRIGTGYTSTIIDPLIQKVVKGVTAKYTAVQLITQRDQVSSDIQSELSELLGPQDITVTGISLTNFDFSPSFNTAIEAKVTAEQNALAAKNKLDQVTYEAQQTVTSAKAQAEAIQIQAQAINSQGGADYVELQRIKAWDGKGCTSYCGMAASTGLLVSGK